jgi:hypothetical protein
MLWRDFLYLLDLVVYFVQQISAAVIVGWILFVTGKTLVKKLMSINLK